MDNEKIDILNKSLLSLRTEIEKTNKSFKKEFFQRILLGVAYGIGTILALAIVSPLLVYVLSKIEWVPVVGEFVSNVIQNLESSH